jgi:membrane associated rhomboid family serine protease
MWDNNFNMVTYALGVLMVAVSVVTSIWPSLASVVGGVGELNYPWQPWTAVFLHGWPGMPMLLHLAGNLILLAIIGPKVEGELGSRRFFVVTLAAILVAGILRILVGVEFNGASAFLWSYAPIYWLYCYKRQRDNAGVLYVMWLIVPAVMGLIFVLNGINPFKAIILGNLYHLSGTIVGFGALWFWKEI